MIFFRGSLDKFDDDYFLDADVAQVSKDTALFIRVDKKSVLATTNSVKKDAVVSPLPVERVKATDLRAAYNITIDGTFLVCDCFGNEFSRMTSKPTGKQVLDALKKVPDSMAAASKKVQAEVDKADAALKIDDLKKAMPALFNAFKLDKVGYEPCAKAQELYASAIEKGRAKLKEYQETSNKDGMKALAESFKKTELEKEIADAQASVVTGDKKVSAVETKKTE